MPHQDEVFIKEDLIDMSVAIQDGFILSLSIMDERRGRYSKKYKLQNYEDDAYASILDENIKKVLYKTSFEDLPLFLNYEGNLRDRVIADIATWRLMGGF